MKVAIEGCCHGELDNIYHTIESARVQSGIEAPDVLICCGDFQSFRNYSDLQTFAAPPKYRQLGSFWKYYNGEKVAPILTVFVGGNHEASGYLWELYHGGWVAPNIYFLGFAGSVILKKTLLDGSIDAVRISGISGIFKQHDYRSGHYERLPYDNGTIRSIYHVREYDIFRLSQLPTSNSSDIFVSHDWPLGIEQHGNTAQLLRAKPFFRNEVASNTLGSPPLMYLLKTIKPYYWFSAHLHVKFAALYHHDLHSKNHQPTTKTPVALNPDEVQIELDEDERKLTPAVPKPSLINPDMILIEDSDDDETHIEAAQIEHCPQTQLSAHNSSEQVDAAHLGGCHTASRNPNELPINLANHEDEKNPFVASLEPPRIQPDMIHIDPSNHDAATPEKPAKDHSDAVTESLMKESTDVETSENKVPLTLKAPEAISEGSFPEASKVAMGVRNFMGARPFDTEYSSAAITARTTRFLALDKCLPRKDFLQILDISQLVTAEQVAIETPPSASKQSNTNSTEDQVLANPVGNLNPEGNMLKSSASLFFDPDWLAITRAFHSYMPLKKYGNPQLPINPIEISSLINQHLEWVNHNVNVKSLEINNVQRFVKTADGIGDPGGENCGQPLGYTNPQTLAFTDLLGIENQINPPGSNLLA